MCSKDGAANDDGLATTETCGTIFAPAMSDATWAGDRPTKKSTGQHDLKSWSKTQSFFALSSAESEPYALVKCVSELLGVRSVLKDCGSNVGGVVKTDASGALDHAEAGSGQSPTH